VVLVVLRQVSTCRCVGKVKVPVTSLAEPLSLVVQEKRIYDLKKKNQELEKFKFVLDYKIKELKREIEPKEKEIRQMKDQISEVRDTLNRYFSWNHSVHNLLLEWSWYLAWCLLFFVIIMQWSQKTVDNFWYRFYFLPRDAMLARCMLSSSVRPSVTS